MFIVFLVREFIHYEGGMLITLRYYLLQYHTDFLVYSVIFAKYALKIICEGITTYRSIVHHYLAHGTLFDMFLAYVRYTFATEKFDEEMPFYVFSKEYLVNNFLVLLLSTELFLYVFLLFTAVSYVRSMWRNNFL